MLGVEPGASNDEIKAAWRALARQHHPDLTGDDPAAVQRATRRMAEINTAYAALTRDERAADQRARRDGEAWEDAGAGRRGTRGGGSGPGAADGATTDPFRAGRAGPPPPKTVRPVTGRVDLSGTIRPRNQTISPPGSRVPLSGQMPLERDRRPPDLRASDPTGPMERARLEGHEAPRIPHLDEALDFALEFGKFHGHTLGQVAAFEPSYIDWLAGTVTRDPELAQAARVIKDDFDRRGVRRPQRPMTPGWRSNPFR